MGEYHEPENELDQAARNRHRAIRSIIEELDAIDWYEQRIAAGPDPELKEILEHNRNEEMEHAVMLLEWLRRKMPEWNEPLQKYLFRSGNIVKLEEAVEMSTVQRAMDLGLAALKDA